MVFWLRSFRPSKAKDKNPCGLTLLAGPDDFELTIVAIHGLGGKSHDTWTDQHTGSLWLRDFLPKNKNLAKTRIYTFGYHADIVTSAKETFYNYARTLIQDLLNMEDKKPLIIVCHSLGGIVAKLAIVEASNSNSAEYNALYQRIAGIVFMGTPHRGSDGAKLGAVAAKTLGRVPFLSINRRLVASFKSHSPELEKISHDFVECLDKRRNDLHVVSVSESKPMAPLGLIVPSDSATLDLPSGYQTKISSHSDHRGMVKFSNIDQDDYKQVMGQLCKLQRLALSLNQSGIKKVSETESDTLLRQLNQMDYEGTWRSYIENQHDGTARLLFENPGFRSWRDDCDGNPVALFWLKGDTGSGKSTQVAQIVQHLKETCPSSVILYSFCSETRYGCQVTPQGILSSLLHQFLKAKPDLCGIVYWQYYYGQNHVLDSCGKLSSAFTTVASHCTSDIYLILDDLEACSNLGAISRFLGDVLSIQTTIKLRILASSNQNADDRVKPVLHWEKAWPFIQEYFMPPKINSDIERYIQSKISALAITPSETVKIMDCIRAQAKYNWALTYLAVQTFTDESFLDPPMIQQKLDWLQSLGSKQYPFYTQHLESIAEKSRSTVRKLLEWILISGEPLTIEQANVVLALDDSFSSLSELNQHVVPDRDGRKVRAMCGPLVRVGRSITIGTSVADYLQDATACGSFWSFTMEDASLQATIDCLNFLSLSDFAGTLDVDVEEDQKLLSSLPFLKYAILHWYRHLKGCQNIITHDDKGLQAIQNFLGRESNMTFVLRIYWPFEGIGAFPPRMITPLHLICFFGLESLFEFVTETYPSPISVSSQPWTPLEMAAAGGYTNIAKMLFRKTPRAFSQDEIYRAVQRAIDRSHEETATYILSHLTDHGQKKKLLEPASIMGQEGIIKTLVNNGVLINEGVRYSSPLEAAAYHGQLGTVELLLQLGADYNIYKASQRGYGSALNAAAAEGHVAVVRALIAAGTDIDLGRHDKSGDTAVSIAARHGHSAVVRDLVQQGASDLLDALREARNAGHEGIERLLQDKLGVISDSSGPNPARADAFDLEDGRVLHIMGDHFNSGREGLVIQLARPRIQAAQKCIEKQQKTRLKYYVSFGVKSYKMAATFGHEPLLEFFTEMGMHWLQTGVQAKYDEGTRVIAHEVTKVLEWTVTEIHRKSIVERMLKHCIDDLHEMVSQGRNDEGKQLIQAGIELIMAAIELQQKEVLELYLDAFIKLFDDMMHVSFQTHIVEIVDAYRQQFEEQLANQAWGKARLRARTVALALENAIKNDRVLVMMELIKVCQQGLEWVFSEDRLARSVVDSMGSARTRETVKSDTPGLWTDVLRVACKLWYMHVSDQALRLRNQRFTTDTVVRMLRLGEESGLSSCAETAFVDCATLIQSSPNSEITSHHICRMLSAIGNQNLIVIPLSIKESVNRIRARLQGEDSYLTSLVA